MEKANSQKILTTSFRELVPEEIAKALDNHFVRNGWVLQRWVTNAENGYQIYFGKDVQVDNYYEYGFPYLYDREEAREFALRFYEKQIVKNSTCISTVKID